MRVALFWSGGKDAAWTLHQLRLSGHEVVALVTTMAQDTGRVMVHEIRRDIVRRQAAIVGLPLTEVDLPPRPSNPLYQFAVGAALEDLRRRTPIGGVAFGDLHLADVRSFRQDLAGRAGLAALFPLWGTRTDLLARAMLKAQVKAHLVVVDSNRIDPTWVGHAWDRRWIEALPSSVDPCGESGEFHTVISAGPMFPEPLELRLAGTAERDGYAYADFAMAGALV